MYLFSIRQFTLLRQRLVLQYIHIYINDASSLFFGFALTCLSRPKEYVLGSIPNLDIYIPYRTIQAFSILRNRLVLCFINSYNEPPYTLLMTLYHLLFPGYPLRPPNPIEVSLFLIGSSIRHYRVASTVFHNVQL